MNIFIKYAGRGFWDKRASPLLNQNINYSDKINQYLIDRKVWIIEQLIKKFKPKHVADAGCGAGGVLLPLAEKYRSIQFYGFDFSRKNIKVIRLNNLDVHGWGVLTEPCDISDKIPFMKKSFDLLYSFDVLCHFKYEKILPTLKEFKRVSKKQYYVFNSLEYTILPMYHFMFSKLKIPKKIIDDLTLKYTKRIEENKMPEMRGLMYE